MKRIILKSGEEKRILRGHPWVYDNEVARILGPGGPALLEPGEIADVESQGKTYLGRAFTNPQSKIIARIYSPSKEGVDKGFFKRRIREALSRRMGYDWIRESGRILFGEADFLPGLIVDRFAGWTWEEVESLSYTPPLSFEQAEAALGPPQSWAAVQFLTFGMDCRRGEILSALEETLGKDLPPGLAGIIEKSSPRIRELEGLADQTGRISGTIPEQGIVIFENGFPFWVDLVGGQKTGHFLDQKENRRRLAQYTPKGARVLDACAYTGGFGIHAARFGAGSVELVDVSQDALERAEQNARLNGVGEQLTLVQGDVFEHLRACQRRHERFDLIILDPPAFAKSRSALSEAIRGYKEINLQALKLLSPGGILLTCSCSQVLEEFRFKHILGEAARDAERRIIQLDFCYQAPDHPILVGYDESQYLKCGYYRVL